MDKHKADTREARGITWFDELVQDVRYGLRTLARHPGYTLLAEYLEQTGSYAEAAGVRLLEASFFPFLTSYRALARVADLAGNADLAGQASAKTKQILGLLDDADALTAKAGGMAKWAKQAGEADLEMLYSGWLRNLGLPVGE